MLCVVGNLVEDVVVRVAGALRRHTDRAAVISRPRVPVGPMWPVGNVVDTTGAGDAFAGGFLAAVIDGAEAVDAPAAGTALARHTLHSAGAELAPD